jgi:hypothetical protein
MGFFFSLSLTRLMRYGLFLSIHKHLHFFKPLNVIESSNCKIRKSHILENLKESHILLFLEQGANCIKKGQLSYALSEKRPFFEKLRSQSFLKGHKFRTKFLSFLKEK